MLKVILVNVLPSLFSIIITSILGLLAFYTKDFLTSKKELFEYEKEQLINKIGYENYEHDIKLAQNIIYAIEQIGKENNWSNTFKHSHAIKLISKKTHLSEDEIFNILKATVHNINHKTYNN